MQAFAQVLEINTVIRLRETVLKGELAFSRAAPIAHTRAITASDRLFLGVILDHSSLPVDILDYNRIVPYDHIHT